MCHIHRIGLQMDIIVSFISFRFGDLDLMFGGSHLDQMVWSWFGRIRIRCLILFDSPFTARTLGSKLDTLFIIDSDL
jgi:hypothetical protein